MEVRQPLTRNHYVIVTVAWYVSTIISGLIAVAIIMKLHTNGTGSTALILEGGAAVLTIFAVISPLAVWLTLRRLNDPAAGMTASAVLMLSHVLVISGPFVFLTPIIGRYLAMARHNSGGY